MRMHRHNDCPYGDDFDHCRASSGIEPLFAVAFKRHVSTGRSLWRSTPSFEAMAWRGGFHSEELMKKIRSGWNVQKLDEVPEKSDSFS